MPPLWKDGEWHICLPGKRCGPGYLTNAEDKGRCSQSLSQTLSSPDTVMHSVLVACVVLGSQYAGIHFADMILDCIQYGCEH